MEKAAAKELAASRKTVKDMEASVADLKSQMEAAVSAIDAAHEREKAAEKKHWLLGRQHSQEIEDQQDKYAKLEEVLAAEREKSAELEGENQKLEQSLAEVRNSKQEHYETLQVGFICSTHRQESSAVLPAMLRTVLSRLPCVIVCRCRHLPTPGGAEGDARGGAGGLTTVHEC